MSRFPIYKIILLLLLAAVVGGWLGTQTAQAQFNTPCVKWQGCCLTDCLIRYSYMCVTTICQVEICNFPTDFPYCAPVWGNWYTDTCVGYGWPACSNPTFFFCPITCA